MNRTKRNYDYKNIQYFSTTAYCCYYMLCIKCSCQNRALEERYFKRPATPYIVLKTPLKL